jgi:MutS domain V
LLRYNIPVPARSSPRQNALSRIERLIARCERLSRGYTWARLGAFLTGAAFTWGASALWGRAVGWAAFIAWLFLLSLIALQHRRLERWNEKFHIWRDLQTEQAARRILDWEHIPAPAVSTEIPPLALDLDLTGPRSLHQLLDQTISHQGSTRLAGWLIAGTSCVDTIAARQGTVRELKDLPRFCNRLLLTFRLLKRQPLDADKLLDWLGTPLPMQALQRLLPWVTILAFGNVALFALYAAGLLAPFWLLSSTAYGILYFTSQGMVSRFLAAVIRLDGELAAFQPLLRFLENYPYGKASHLAAVCAPFTGEKTRPARLLCRLRRATLAAGLRMNPALGLLFNLLTPWDFWAAWLAGHQKERMARLLPVWLDAFHELETLTSLGMFAAQNPDYAFPIITDQETPSKGTDRLPAVFAARQMGHPLLPPTRRVCNDFTTHALGELNLITGSNMAGKSTFIRTLGVNLCLAYAGAPVCAASLQSLPFRLYTCIRLSDSLTDGFSYFYAEVKRLKGLLETLHPPASQTRASEPAPSIALEFPLLYLIDEIFRGTNNRERLVGSRAYIKELLKAPAVGFLATHDLELATLADAHPQVHNFHFRDDVSAGTLTFDYHLRPGPSPTTNALKIMAQEGLPVDGE